MSFKRFSMFFMVLTMLGSMAFGVDASTCTGPECSATKSFSRNLARRNNYTQTTTNTATSQTGSFDGEKGAKVAIDEEPSKPSCWFGMGPNGECAKESGTVLDSDPSCAITNDALFEHGPCMKPCGTKCMKPCGSKCMKPCGTPCKALTGGCPKQACRKPCPRPCAPAPRPCMAPIPCQQTPIIEEVYVEEPMPQQKILVEPTCRDFAPVELQWVDFRLQKGARAGMSGNKLGNYRFRIFGCRREAKNILLNKGRAIQKDLHLVSVFEETVTDCIPVIKVPRNMCIEDTKKPMPEYILTAEITDYFMNVCDGYDWGNSRKADERSGSSEITVTWRLMDLTKTNVIWKGVTSGRAELEEGNYNGELALIENAFRNASEKLKALPEFRREIANRVHPQDLAQQRRDLVDIQNAMEPAKCGYQEEIEEVVVVQKAGKTVKTPVRVIKEVVEKREVVKKASDNVEIVRIIERRGEEKPYKVMIEDNGTETSTMVVLDGKVLKRISGDKKVIVERIQEGGGVDASGRVVEDNGGVVSKLTIIDGKIVEEVKGEKPIEVVRVAKIDERGGELSYRAVIDDRGGSVSTHVRKDGTVVETIDIRPDLRTEVITIVDDGGSLAKYSETEDRSSIEVRSSLIEDRGGSSTTSVSSKTRVNVSNEVQFGGTIVEESVDVGGRQVTTISDEGGSTSNGSSVYERGDVVSTSVLSSGTVVETIDIKPVLTTEVIEECVTCKDKTSVIVTTISDGKVVKVEENGGVSAVASKVDETSGTSTVVSVIEEKGDVTVTASSSEGTIITETIDIQPVLKTTVEIIDESGNSTVTVSTPCEVSTTTETIEKVCPVKDVEKTENYWVDIFSDSKIDTTNMICITAKEPYKVLDEEAMRKIKGAVLTVSNADGKKASGILVSEELVMTSSDIVIKDKNNYTLEATDGKRMTAKVFRVNPNRNMALLMLDQKTMFEPLPFNQAIVEDGRNVFMSCGLTDLSNENGSKYMNNSGKVRGYRYSDKIGTEILADTFVKGNTLGCGMFEGNGSIAGVSHKGIKVDDGTDLFLPVDVALNSLGLKICNTVPNDQVIKPVTKAVEESKDKTPTVIDKKKRK